MDAVTHGSVSVLIGLIFVVFYHDIPIWLLLIVMFVFGILVDYDHVFYYRKNFKEIKIWNIPKLIKVYFQTLDERDDFIYHTWLHEPFGVLVVGGLSYLIFGIRGPYPELAILASCVYLGHFLLDLLSGKMKPLAPFYPKFTIDLRILPASSFTAATITLTAFLIGLLVYIFI